MGSVFTAFKTPWNFTLLTEHLVDPVWMSDTGLSEMNIIKPLTVNHNIMVLGV
jgi:hypothetical protein